MLSGRDLSTNDDPRFANGQRADAGSNPYRLGRVTDWAGQEAAPRQPCALCNDIRRLHTCVCTPLQAADGGGAATAAGTGVRSLQWQCGRRLMSEACPTEDILQVVATLRAIGTGAGSFGGLAAHFDALVSERFGLLAEWAPEGDLRRALGDARYKELAAAQAEAARAKSLMRREGAMMERLSVALEENELDRTVSSGGTETTFYPLKALVAGVAWPEGVSPAAREQALSPEEFLGVFGVKKAEFARLDWGKRKELKQKHGLF